MSENTKIQWADHTWSPWLGCRKVSPGCQNCYITSTTPFRTRKIQHGDQREELSEAYWKQPLKWNSQAAKNGTRPRVFPSLCDPFDQEVPFSWKVNFWRLVSSTPNLDWLILTKRPERVDHDWGDMIRQRVVKLGSTLPKNVWLGVSVEDQQRADERIPILLSIPARIRFLSVEPMLEAVDLSPWLWESGCKPHCGDRCSKDADCPLDPSGHISLVIVGGESGRNARPCNVEWIRGIVQQCQAAGVPVFVKQLGSNCRFFGDLNEWPKFIARKVCDPDENDLLRIALDDPKGGDPSEWPEYLRVREMPSL